jgi:hypothetical protein
LEPMSACHAVLNILVNGAKPEKDRRMARFEVTGKVQSSQGVVKTAGG